MKRNFCWDNIRKTNNAGESGETDRRNENRRREIGVDARRFLGYYRPGSMEADADESGFGAAAKRQDRENRKTEKGGNDEK